MDVIELLRNHRSIRKFTDEVIDDETVEAIVAAGLASATSSTIPFFNLKAIFTEFYR